MIIKQPITHLHCNGLVHGLLLLNKQIAHNICRGAQFTLFRCQEEMSQQVEAIQPADDTRLVIQKFKVDEEIQWPDKGNADGEVDHGFFAHW